jgi:hypothetical protein
MRLINWVFDLFQEISARPVCATYPAIVEWVLALHPLLVREASEADDRFPLGLRHYGLNRRRWRFCGALHVLMQFALPG